MGVAITELLVRKEIELEALRGKTIAVDAANHLYQYLSTIRQPDGSLLTDNQGNVTSHLVGLLSRTTHLMKQGIKLVYVYDGKVPELKYHELEKRREVKENAAKQFEIAKEAGDEEQMKKFASRTSRLSKDMILESQKLLQGLGVPYVIAPSEGEAQAAYMTKKGECYAVSSQDADSLLFGAPVVVRNLSVSGRRKTTGKLAYQHVNIEKIELRKTLEQLGINREQLIRLAMLVGTDYNRGGIKGIGPKKALQLVKKYDAEELFKEVEWEKHWDVDWKEIYDLIYTMPATDDYHISFGNVDREKLMKLLVEDHGFSEERVDRAISELAEAAEKRKQKGLLDF